MGKGGFGKDLARMGLVFIKRVMAMTKAMALTKTKEARMNVVARLSLKRLTFTEKSALLLTSQAFSRIPLAA